MGGWSSTERSRRDKSTKDMIFDGSALVSAAAGGAILSARP